MIRYPYHLYLRYLVLEGDEVEEIREHLADLAYTPPSAEDVQGLISTMREGRIVDDHLRERHGVHVFDENTHARSGAYLIVESPEVRTMTERLLLNRLPLRDTATILSHRFDERLSEESVRFFRDGFWDTVSLSNLDFVRYMKSAGKRSPVAKSGGAITEKPIRMAWEEGVYPGDADLSVDDMIRTVTVDSYMQFKKNQDRSNTESQVQARGWASTLLAAARASKAARIAGNRKQVMEVKPILQYSDSIAPSLDDLHRNHSETNLGTGHIVDEVEGKEQDEDAA